MACGQLLALHHDGIFPWWCSEQTCAGKQPRSRFARVFGLLAREMMIQNGILGENSPVIYRLRLLRTGLPNTGAASSTGVT